MHPEHQSLFYSTHSTIFFLFLMPGRVGSCDIVRASVSGSRLMEQADNVGILAAEVYFPSTFVSVKVV